MATVIVHPPAATGSLPLVLLAPFPFDSRIWAEAAALVDGAVYTVEPPGFGGETDEAPSIDGYAEAVLAALDDLGVDRFAVAGNSMGGYVAMALADLAATRVAAIGLFGTKASADTDEARAGRLAMADAAESGTPASELVGPMIERLVSPGLAVDDPPRWAQVADWLAQAPPAGIAWAQRAMASRPDRFAALAALPAPGVVVIGSEDVLMPKAEQAQMAEVLGSLIELPCGHLVPFERPSQTAEILSELIRSAR